MTTKLATWTTINDNYNCNKDTTNNEDTETMFPKVKPMAAQKTTSKKSVNKDDKTMPPLAAKLLAISTSNFSVEASNPLKVAYYAISTYNYTSAVIQVNGMMQKGEYEVQVARDGHSLTFVRAICTRLIDKKNLKTIMKDDYHKSSAHVVPWDDTALEMYKKVHPKNGLFWGKPQVVQIKWKYTGMPNAENKHDYLMEYRVKDKRGELHMQCNCIVLVTVKNAEDWAKAELEVKSGYVDLFGIDSSHSQDNAPSPPP
jgi:hypothetical protein